MRLLISLWLVAMALNGCKPGLTEDRGRDNIRVVPGQGGIDFSGMNIRLADIKYCHYPSNDPLFEKKWNRKLLVVKVTLDCNEGGKKADLVPEGALLTDSKGNEYEPSPAIIAMAQNNQCIRGDDIKAYNAIWNGDVIKGNRYTAWVLGFEVPEDAVPEKLYWNTRWKKDQLYFVVYNTDTAINH